MEGPPSASARPSPCRARVEAEGCGAQSLPAESPGWRSHSHPHGARPEEVLRSCGLTFPACGEFLECASFSVAAAVWRALP